uniref:Uncharacterized protein n=1 Tax=Nymphaea colorata TaxID=210225 RepID=A0A5K1HNC0_9MAGN|nr:unnamed protein product [Nymphaea colorata]
MGSVHGFSFLLPHFAQRVEGDSASAVRKGNLILFPRDPDEVTLGEPPTPTIVHVRSILDLTNYPSYLLYVLDSPSLSQ